MAYDVAIIGLGPAGSILAKLLPPDCKVIAIDKKSMADEAGFHKPCGGLLAPDAQKALARLGLTLPMELLVDPQIFSVRTIDLKSGLIRHYQRFYLNLDRHRFDLWLKSIIPKTVDVWNEARCTGVSRCEDGWRVTWKEGNCDRTATARYLVGADGANSLVRRILYPDTKIRTYLSIQQHFKDEHPSPFYSCVFDPEVTDCYAWGLSKSGRFIFGGAFSPSTAKQDFAALKEKLKAYGFQMEHPLVTEACMVLRPMGHQFCLGKDNAFLIGEAAGLISPSSLEGISYAINSAFFLAEALARGGDVLKHYRRATWPLRLKLIGKNIKSPFMYSPFLRRMVMRSGLNSIPMKITWPHKEREQKPQ